MEKIIVYHGSNVEVAEPRIHIRRQRNRGEAYCRRISKRIQHCT